MDKSWEDHFVVVRKDEASGSLSNKSLVWIGRSIYVGNLGQWNLVLVKQLGCVLERTRKVPVWSLIAKPGALPFRRTTDSSDETSNLAMSEKERNSSRKEIHTTTTLRNNPSLLSLRLRQSRISNWKLKITRRWCRSIELLYYFEIECNLVQWNQKTKKIGYILA